MEANQKELEAAFSWCCFVRSRLIFRKITHMTDITSWLEMYYFIKCAQYNLQLEDVNGIVQSMHNNLGFILFESSR